MAAAAGRQVGVGGSRTDSVRAQLHAAPPDQAGGLRREPLRPRHRCAPACRARRPGFAEVGPAHGRRCASAFRTRWAGIAREARFDTAGGRDGSPAASCGGSAAAATARRLGCYCGSSAAAARLRQLGCGSSAATAAAAPRLLRRLLGGCCDRSSTAAAAARLLLLLRLGGGGCSPAAAAARRRLGCCGGGRTRWPGSCRPAESSRGGEDSSTWTGRPVNNAISARTRDTTRTGRSCATALAALSGEPLVGTAVGRHPPPPAA
ncbi:hypothetical protein Actkin_04506 [Actinokineospora sp. UTMC 2448]|nr:hypothetical protein Actkin_04506 [Actinokineospora sp. UTMC 2448]